MSKESFDWGSFTTVETKTFENKFYLYETESEDSIHVKPCCLSLGASGWKIDDFLEFLREHFARYVLPPDVFEQHRTYPMNKAQEIAAPNIDFRSGGIVSEFLLYLFVEGHLDMPQVSYRLYYSDEANQDVKGSDGLFVGTFNGNEVIGIGEGKFYSSVQRSIKEAADSIEEYHGSGGSEETRRELRLASDRLEDDLDIEGDELQEIINRLSIGNYEDYRIFHPIFIGHQTKRIDWISEGPVDDTLEDKENSPDFKTQMQNKLEEHFDDYDYFEDIDEKWSDAQENTRTAVLYFIFLPVPNKAAFKRELYRGMFFPSHDELNKRDLLDFVGFESPENTLEALEPDDAEEFNQTDLIELLGSDDPETVLNQMDDDVSDAVLTDISEILGIADSGEVEPIGGMSE